jgi:hypothetical protein
MLEANSKRPVRERLTARRLFELLRAEGYEGAYDSVQRHVRDWRRQRSQQARSSSRCGSRRARPTSSTVGKERRFNRRFLAMCSHHLVEPTACTPRVKPVG